MEEKTKPKSTWQVWMPLTKKLQVHETESPESRVVFYGDPAEYSGFATEPAAPTSEFLAKYQEKQ